MAKAGDLSDTGTGGVVVPKVKLKLAVVRMSLYSLIKLPVTGEASMQPEGVMQSLFISSRAHLDFGCHVVGMGLRD